MLTVENLHVEIDSREGAVSAVSAVSFTVSGAQTFAIVGESGCGKSMTALAIMRLLPDVARITQGRVLLDGRDLLTISERSMLSVRGAQIGMIFQEPATSLNPVMTVGEQIAEAISLHQKMQRNQIEQRVEYWLHQVGLEPAAQKKKAFAHELSGGQKQRVMIAMMLAMNPSVIIADEPTTALDVTLQAQILDLLKHLQKTQGLTLILITHDLAVVQKYADRVALMYAGEIVEEARAEDFFNNPLHPYAKKLLAAVPHAGQRDQALRGIDGVVPRLINIPLGCRFASRCDRRSPACCSAPVELTERGEHRIRCLFAEAADNTPRSVRVKGKALGATLLELSEFCVAYQQRGGFLRTGKALSVVKNVALTLRAGETLALVGESGSGKTTLAKAIMGLCTHATVTGTMSLEGQRVDYRQKKERERLRHSIQMIFQDPFASLDPRMTVGDCIAEGMTALGIVRGREACEKRVAELLAEVGLDAEAARRLPHEFSGGQRQRIAIARALAVNPRIIICDEPTSALDVSVQAQILNLMMRIQQEKGLAFLFITHNFAVVSYLADRIAVMQGGQIVEQGQTQTVMNAPVSGYTRTLLEAVPVLRSK